MNSSVQDYPDFESLRLGEECVVWIGRLPEKLQISFEALWALHPEERREIPMVGRWVKAPRWDQAFGMDYHYRGIVNQALPIPDLLRDIFEWTVATVDARLNGLLVNWYDGAQGHYIGRHRDSVKKMIEGAPIVTISLGEDRVFRMRPPNLKGFRDFSATARSMIIIPYATNRRWFHEVPRFKHQIGRRISITIRGFISSDSP